jgi:hypothetical protein
MVNTVIDTDGKVVAYMEWITINNDNLPDDDGRFLYIRNTWVYDKYRHRGYIKQMIREVLNQENKVEYAYWERSKYNQRIEYYSKERLLNKARTME